MEEDRPLKLRLNYIYERNEYRQIITIFFSVLGMPFIRTPPHSVTARAGDRASLQCLAEGDPSPKIYWISNR